MDPFCWISTVENLNKLLNSARNCESLEKKLNSSYNAVFFVNALDVDLLADVSHFDVHKLTRRLSWVFAAIVAN